ncbi:Arc family DNA-binding protein [Enterobacteriaceae bacterium 4M9]|nr:Arc family DNA-binding protein [Enterobacteriaceae bacterium 4M9]
MSREDPQLRIRLPSELKKQVEDASRANNRSMNAEIVSRLDASFLSNAYSEEFISAEDALKFANKAKEELSGIILERAFAEISKKIRLGHTSFYVELGDLDLEGLEDDEFPGVFELAFSRLQGLGYTISEMSWDVDGFMVEIPKKKPTE